ncbi:phosphoenolpyruvate carboxykinase [Melioribacter roseus P3M-2]|uniref:Phosphoenolpyruvate carboxykinase (ATP) n=1 Tax=Melioribacter roseus (strain DSM 23840 / JCM 17771 / VKM B-2668 / P3M-2) TaxID=1191523 RepID=I6YW28_MELRP|nr:phosphoenolpyruvate carboxykinase [Melioribacter roseus]AFN74797.1 phosphoenolpyruvate carboxykinase [Melioribacter roseus P3M-2]
MKSKLEIWQQLNDMGIKNINNIFYNLTTPALYEQAARRREAMIAHMGPLVVRTGQHTGRSPNDKFLVKEPSSQEQVWWGNVNKPIEEKYFDRIFAHMCSYVQNKDLYVQDLYAGADPDYRLPIRVITETAWHNLFARNLFIKAEGEDLVNHKPEFTVINLPYFQADPETDGTNSGVFIIINFGKKLVLIGGTSYAGEIKKSIFTIMNYLMPLKGVMSMHCSANVGKEGDVAVMFGLSGTGKTTLSADPERKLIGDDEHGWSDKGVFNYEGGCYAKVIRLSAESEPFIYETTRKFGTILENVAMDVNTRMLDLNDDSLTENTRAAYPINYIPNIAPEGRGGHPKNIVMLTADAFGVMPPIAKLTPEQAMYHFLSGYTAKVAGTEKGVTEPKATFSACFGAPFMVLKPSVYAKLLGDKIQKYNVNCWLVNTGWTGGPYGTGSRMKIEYTRRMLNAALSGELESVVTYKDNYFGLEVPTKINGIPDEILHPQNTWPDKSKYDETARKLAAMFKENFKNFEANVSEDVKKAGPIV